MAEGFLRTLGEGRFEAFSAGTRPADAIHPIAIEVMHEAGIDISHQRPTCVKEYFGKLTAHHLIIVCETANESCPRMFPGMLNRHFWPFDDPATFVGSPEATKEKFRTVRDQIDTRIKEWLKNEH
jgi:arsenate reductase